MTDKEIIQGLIARDNRVTKEFFFVKCRPLFCSIIQKVFDYEVEYDEFVNELYVYLMANDASKLRNFEYWKNRRTLTPCASFHLTLENFCILTRLSVLAGGSFLFWFI